MEEIQTGLRGVLKLLIFLIFLISYALCACFIYLVVRDKKKRRLVFSRNVRLFSSLIIKGLGMKLIVTNKPKPHQQGRLIVSNHMGFVDILLLSSIEPVSFITSHEMRETPVLGQITEMAGCFYVERRSRTKILQEMKNLADSLKDGLDIVLYPEATSTNGEQVLPFKRTLMMAAAEAGVPIQPVVVNFRQLNGEEFNLKWRDSVCWYGDISFAESFWNTLRLKSLVAEIEYLDQLRPTSEDDRGLVADKAHQMISEKFVPVKGLPVAETVPSDLEADPT